ncbi:MAG: MmcQ/YjbR family DNA-binding protein [Deltaproteobacteria bacterium]|nr:MmcQ/YjbR family DNA-binding protein [Deltaproteobacteria bacterium]
MAIRPEIAKVLKQALAFPGAHEAFPWGERVVKVKGKVFVFLGRDEGESWGMALKLPHSGQAALMLPFTEPTGYGLGKSGWVTCNFGKKEKAPLELLQKWLEESYRAVAPAKLLKALDGVAKPQNKKVTKRGRRST